MMMMIGSMRTAQEGCHAAKLENVKKKRVHFLLQNMEGT